MDWDPWIRPLPPLWEWIGAISGIAALPVAILALLAVAQMFLGKPKIEVEFETFPQGLERILIVYLKNPPIRNRFLKRLGVKRDTVQSLTGSVRVSEFGSGAIVAHLIHSTFFDSDADSDKDGKSRIVLPPTYSVGASFSVARWDVNADKAFLVPDRLRRPIELPKEYYRADIILVQDGEPKKPIAKRFVVGDTLDDLTWTT